MRKRPFALSVLLAAVLYWPISSQAEPLAVSPSTNVASDPSSYYLRDGNTLRLVTANPAKADYSHWEVWLYPYTVRISNYAGGLAYVRWGMIQGDSAKTVMDQLTSYQQFERAYTNLFGQNTWGRLTFSYSLGPIAIANEPPLQDTYVLGSTIDSLSQGLRLAVSELEPSLLNARPGAAADSVRQYFNEVRDSMQDVSRFYDQLSRLPTQHNYLAQKLALLAPHVTQAETVSPQVIQVLPSVRPPSATDWMSYSEQEGREGTVTKTITEIGSSAWIQESWTGGDGSMSGTKIITIVPYQDIGTINIWAHSFGNQRLWTLSIEPANHGGFPQSTSSPDRTTPERTYPAVNLKSTDASIFLDYNNPTEAEEAYAFFLYHKQLESKR